MNLILKDHFCFFSFKATHKDISKGGPLKGWGPYLLVIIYFGFFWPPHPVINSLLVESLATTDLYPWE